MESTRRRKNKSKQKQVQETVADSETSDENIKKVEHKYSDENNKKVEHNHSDERLLNGNKQAEKRERQNDVDRSVLMEENKRLFRVNFEIDLVSVVLLFCGVVTRMYRLEEPKNIV